MRIKKHKAILRWGTILLSALWYLPSQAQTTDSLSYYLETAARNNPSVNSSFALYKASLEKIPQAGAFSDPELEMGFSSNRWNRFSGKQVADFTLMQMFPWFGTRKAARSEATEMARMAYEQFRESRNNLFYEVKSQWYQLNNLNEQYKNTGSQPRTVKAVGTVGTEPLYRILFTGCSGIVSSHLTGHLPSSPSNGKQRYGKYGEYELPPLHLHRRVAARQCPAWAVTWRG